ncbi:hypothetical protein OAN61_00430 [bacterium]|nr:hypothetical protein [bacterium]
MLPAKAKTLVRRWHQQNPEYEQRTVTDIEAAALARAFHPVLGRAFEEAPLQVMRGDLARYLVIHE